MREIKGVFFDLHGTLLLSPDLDAAWEDWLKAFYSCMVECGLSMSREEFAEEMEDLFDKPMPESSGTGLSVFERRVMDFCDRLGLVIDRDYLRWMVDHVIEVWHRDFYIDPDTYDVLEELSSRYKIALITNWDHAPKIRSLLHELDLDRYFKTVIISDEADAAKPDSRIFHIALKKTGLKPSEVTYIGDAPEDVKGSLAAGIQPVLIRRGKPREEWSVKPDTKQASPHEGIVDYKDIPIIRSLKELLDLS
ncbi:MAG: HAD family hydrolase [Candidatus Bathyarchaeota archaeon]|nr:MAG: HAD family hydrolase [Candidatus Bathyarchaeota archaeon]